MDLNPRKTGICRITKGQMIKTRLFHKLCFFIFTLILCREQLHALEFQSGLGMGTQIHYSKNTFRFAPGAAFHFSASLYPRVDLDFRLFTGAFFGYSIFIESGFLYYFKEDGYRPGIGVCINLDFGGVIFHTDSSENIIYPTYPEAGFCITAKPANFRFSRVTLSFIDISAGTDLLLPGRIFLFYFELFHIEYRF